MQLQPDDIVVDVIGHGVVLTMRGEMDMTRVPAFEAALDEALAHDPADVKVDMTQLTFIDSRGIGALVMAWRRTRAAGIPFTLAGTPPANVRRVLELTGIGDLLGS
jgi:anti-sigma B factor antagonist